MSIIKLGSAYPIGSSITKNGVNFSIAVPNAQIIELLLFEHEDDQDPKEIICLNHDHRSGDYWHVEVEGLTEGCLYCYRVSEYLSDKKESIYSKNILIDPCARAITGWNCYERVSSKDHIPSKNKSLKGVVCERNRFNFESYPRPRNKWNKTIIYELHVGGFTNHQSSKIKGVKAGTFLGLIDKINYLKDIGITAIELLPVFAFDPYDAPTGLTNYWGYSPINWFTPHHKYVAGPNPLDARNQFRELVSICHKNGIEVIIDVVYNHTCEGDQNGPAISWKGFAESTYYYKNKKGNFLDVSGCGNTIAANRPIVRQLILESMRCWAYELGVDGFRFDLGIALSRGEDLQPLENPPLFEEMETDPLLSDLKFISEPWDCGGLYQLEDFPAKRMRTWNGHFRDDLRKFWKGDKNSTWALKDRLIGNPNLYKEKNKSAELSINFITAHDGFTLNDLVSFNTKHNLANGESNRDGDNHNNSWNHGVEGVTSNKEINILRSKQKRNMLSSLLLSPGIPMLLMGDEIGRSQGGNNNTWCQNNSLGWMVWEPNICDLELKYFLRKLLKIRKSLPELFSPNQSYSHLDSISENSFWVQWHGVKLNKPDWGSWSHTISYSLNKKNEDAVLWVGLNAYQKEMEFEIPKPISPWVKVLDTKCLVNKNIPKKPLINQKNIQIENRSLVLLLTSEYASRVKLD